MQQRKLRVSIRNHRASQSGAGTLHRIGLRSRTEVQAAQRNGFWRYPSSDVPRPWQLHPNQQAHCIRLR